MHQQLKQESAFLAEMKLVKTGARMTDHVIHKINPRSKINLYVQKGTRQMPTFKIATTTVDESLIKSRLISKSWMNALYKKTSNTQATKTL